MPVVIVNKTRLFYRLEGSDGFPVLALSHSIGTDHGMWEPQVHALLPYFRILQYDTRGHGGSEASGGEYTIEELGRDFLGILDALNSFRCRILRLVDGRCNWPMVGITCARAIERFGAGQYGAEDWNMRELERANQCRTARWNGGGCRFGHAALLFGGFTGQEFACGVGSVGLSGN